MLIIKAAKCLMYGLSTLVVAFGALGTGLVFSASNIGLARNPEMGNQLLTNSFVGFALIETFVAIGVIIVVVAHLFI